MTRQWVAAEAIAHQGRSKLYDKLTDKLSQLMSSGNITTDEIAKLGLAADIEDACGISVNIEISPAPFRNAGVHIPQLDKNHPIVPSLYIKHDLNLPTVKKFMKGNIVGSVDKANSKVYGVFNKIVCPMFLTRGLLTSPDASASKIAGVILHELGHVFSYFERLIDTVTQNYAIAAAVEDMLKTSDKVERIRIIDEVDKLLGSDIADKDTIAESDEKGVIFTHLASSVHKTRRNLEGDMVYSYRSFEAASDQFATRHGAGPDLVAFLVELESESWFSPSTMAWPTHIGFEVAKAAIVIFAGSVLALASPATLVMSTIAMMAARPMDKIYDEPKARVERIEREMVAELKNRNLPEFRRKQVLVDIATTREMSKVLNDKRTIFESIWAYVIPVGNDNRKKMEFQQSLERLANNDLYVASALFT